MNITNAPALHVEQSEKLTSRSATPSTQEQKPNHAPEKNTSEVSALSKSIDSTFESLSSQPDVDMEMVAKVKAAIANGEFQIDIDATVNALVELHK
ncbi:flagellar biosynthesis anti-sigma factor FlgM [Pseudoalteromonas aliena]|uniref:Negative regulator of flagellin synthesis n=1 Tax=Pseudoalteromonas aliena TaxID=247523 RepID=A0A1Q2H3I7_9GAMM|nr:flagellar biosynthesis anti-sigma factor FlgM [Pseudoalteromonas aliena]AQP98988.1 flagellar biosynthesis anti-sigma factor FlgM [Pseudoalteromonas aliena]AQQ01935.1 flagellar biosynthesis anti-sigma factor FlgM [Pseudoalteromonas aliena]